MNIHKFSRNWNCTTVDYWLGPPIAMPNQSKGYHGILKQWWDHYKPANAGWLLISELNRVKPYFQSIYPTDSFKTLELFTDDANVDYHISLCDRSLPNKVSKVDVVVCQATLEHVHDPFTSMYNMAQVLNSGGIMTVHTHVQPFMYHPHPRDYIRFFPDWFIDMQNWIPEIQLVELVDHNGHIFAAYKKL